MASRVIFLLSEQQHIIYNVLRGPNSLEIVAQIADKLSQSSVPLDILPIEFDQADSYLIVPGIGDHVNHLDLDAHVDFLTVTEESRIMARLSAFLRFLLNIVCVVFV